MQRAIERDSANRCNDAMCAANLSRISKLFTDAALREVLDDIPRRKAVFLKLEISTSRRVSS
jgi:hypothetical protein